LAVAIANLALLVAGLVRTKVVAVDLGVSASGLFAQLQTLATFASALASLGLVNVAVREVSVADAAGDVDAVRRVVTTVALAPAALAAALLPLVWLLRTPLTAALLSSNEPTAWVVETLSSVPFAVAAGAAVAVHQGLRLTRRLATAAAVATVLSIAVTIGLIEAFGEDGAVWTLPAAAAVDALVLLASVAQVLSWRWLPRLAPRATTRRLLVWGAASLAALTLTLLGDLLVRSVAVHELGARANGLYQPVYLLSNSGFVQIGNAVGVVLLASLSGLVSEANRAQASEVLNGAIRAGVAIVVALGLICIGCRSLLLVALASSAFTGGSGLLALQIIGEVPRMGAYAAGAALLPLGRVKAWLACGVTASVVRVATCLALIPELGVRALAASYVLEWSIVCGAAFLATRRDSIRAVPRAWGVIAAGTATLAIAATGTLLPSPWDVGVVMLLIVIWLRVNAPVLRRLARRAV